jgi:hypothetical protein
MLARPKAILYVDNSVCVCVCVCVCECLSILGEPNAALQLLSVSVSYLVTPAMGCKIQEKYKSTEIYMMA